MSQHPQMLHTGHDDMNFDDEPTQPGPALLFQQEIFQSQAAPLAQPLTGPTIQPPAGPAATPEIFMARNGLNDHTDNNPVPPAGPSGGADQANGLDNNPIKWMLMILLWPSSTLIHLLI
jgi:hypothetical protein